MRKIMMFLLAFCVVGSLKVYANESMQFRENISLDKVWTITFNNQLDYRTVTNETIFIRTEDGETINTIQVYVNPMNSKQVLVSNSNPYTYSTGYYLYITRGIQDINGNTISNPITLKFTTMDDPHPGNLNEIKNPLAFIRYLNYHYSFLETLEDRWDIAYSYKGEDETALYIEMELTGDSQYHLYDEGLDILEYDRPITEDEVTEVEKTLRELKMQIANDTMIFQMQR